MNVSRFTVRLVLPFTMASSSAQAAAENLAAQRAGSGRFKDRAMFVRERRHSLYVLELLAHVDDYLFPKEGGRGCAYLAAPDYVGGAFGQARIGMRSGNRFVVRKAGVVPLYEMFLTDYGSGVLSVNLAVEPCPNPDPSARPAISLDDVREIAYQLSQGEPRKWGKLTFFHQTEPAAAPAGAAAKSPDIFDRIGVDGATATIMDLIKELKHPLTTFGYELLQETMMAYTVVEFDDQVRFDQRALPDDIAAGLAHLSQLEEANHPGVAHALDLINVVPITWNHIAGLSLLGAAHFVSRQHGGPAGTANPTPAELPQDGGFDAERATRALVRYFTPWLVVLLETVTMRRIVRDARNTMAQGGKWPRTELQALQADLLSFGVNGHFARVSVRHTVHRYFVACQQALDADRIREAIRNAMVRIDAKITGMRQIAINRQIRANAIATRHVEESMEKSLGAAKHNLDSTVAMQRHVAWIECFLVSVYAAHLTHMCAEHHGDEHQRWVFVLGAAVVAGLTAMGFVRPWKHH